VLGAQAIVGGQAGNTLSPEPLVRVDVTHAERLVIEAEARLAAQEAGLAGYPEATVVGSDYHEVPIESARKRASGAGVAERVSFEVASAQTFGGTDYDLVATFDCLHDMGDPIGAARHIRESLAPDGTWIIVEPAAQDTVGGNLNRSVASTTRSRRSCACPARCRRPVATHSAPRPVRRPAGGSRPMRDSPGSVARRKRRSTWCSRLVPDTLGRRSLLFGRVR